MSKKYIKEIILIGGGGHCKVIIDAIESSGEFSIYGIVDQVLPEGASVLGVKVLGKDDILPELFERGIRYSFIAVGSVGNCDIRKRIYANLKKIGFKLPVIIHPKAVISKYVRIEEGAFVAARAVINVGTSIGKNAIINTSSSVDHDCNIGDFVHIAPGATLSGSVKVGDETHIGTGANVIQSVSIGKKCMIGAGSTLRKDLKDGQAYLQPFNDVNQGKARKKVFIVAEAGVNHNGSIEIAKKMIDAACEAGADAVKFQTFQAEELATAYAPKANYQTKVACSRESQLAMLKKLELGRSAHKALINYCAKKKIIFISSPFDLKSVGILKELGVRIFKIPSGEITNLPYLRKIGGLKKKIFLSTGMSNLREIKDALNALTMAGTKRENIVMLHCNTEYPTPLEDVNLLAMVTLKALFNIDVGYSDHTLGVEVPVAAVTLGASVIEKHFTLDKKAPGPDHKASLEPDELKEMVRAIRKTEKILGTGIKEMSRSEIKNVKVVRKSIVAATSIKKGEVFTDENLSAKRPGTGLSPMKWDMVLRRTAKRDFSLDELIEL
jgi:N,N'-diacetyllegionaminate synthase